LEPPRKRLGSDLLLGKRLGLNTSPGRRGRARCRFGAAPLWPEGGGAPPLWERGEGTPLPLPTAEKGKVVGRIRERGEGAAARCGGGGGGALLPA